MDGRVRRGEVNRQAIIDAALELVAEQGAFPTANAVAERAGVAKRSVFHHFPDMDTLFAEAADRQAERHWHVLEPLDRDAPLYERIGTAVDQRAHLFEAIGDVRRVALLHEAGSPMVSSRLQESRSALRRHLRRALAPELSGLDRTTAEGLQALASWETWEVLRRHQGLSVASAAAAVQSTLEVAFARAMI